ncbi:18181_t:CDS:2 [Dentiscutata erythropus]|uniref:18181_t:CDS:1 n=1 Tax=Dentiscutata erythropus TaxID=1348616 RepID=A0A9N9HZG4_9GLOM|nr:18181_t:CDS:2 [Dentiscutata erythropus]
MASTRNPSLNKEELCNKASNEWKILKNNDENVIQNKISKYLTMLIHIHGYEISEEIPHNAAFQKRIIELIKNTHNELDEIKKMIVITTNAEMKALFVSKIDNI